MRDNKGHWLPGHSGNPAGKPKHTFMTDDLIKLLKKKYPIGSDGSKVALYHAFNQMLLNWLTSKKEQIDARLKFLIIQWCYNRVEGIATQTFEVSGKDGKPIKHKIDLGKLSPEEKRALLRIVEKAEGKNEERDAG